MTHQVRPGEGSSPSPSPGPRLFNCQKIAIEQFKARQGVVILPNTFTGRDAAEWHRLLSYAVDLGFFNAR